MNASGDRTQIERDFASAVNMTAKQLERWLDTGDSRSVGDSNGGESTGHRSGRRIVRILEKPKSKRTDSDLDHMRRVSGYVKRHLGQRPSTKQDVAQSRWRYSLMNWGHDPLK